MTCRGGAADFLLYFAGLDFASKRKSGTILAIAEEAANIVDHIARR
jgi:putative flavoprotein involved in K+ transport